MSPEEVSKLLASAAHKLTAASHLVLLPKTPDLKVKEEIEQAQKLTAMAHDLAGEGVL